MGLPSRVYLWLFIAFFSAGTSEVGAKVLPIKPKKLIVFVHGYAGSQLIDEARQRARTPVEVEKAFYGDYVAMVGVFQDYLKSHERQDVGFFTFKYNTFKNSNVESARVLNMGLSGLVHERSAFPSKIGKHNSLPEGTTANDYTEIFFVTLSNGNLVVREAVLEAFGLRDDRSSGKGSLNYKKILSKTDSSIRVPASFTQIQPEEDLQNLYLRSSIFDVSPILGGASDARGALFPKRHGEIDPFGRHHQWLFSEKNIEVYDRAVEGRHHTFFVVGDTHTRGLWQYWCKTKTAAMNFLNHMGTFYRGYNWKAAHLGWFARFERARGEDREHHVEYMPMFPADNYCTRDEYLRGNQLFQAARSVEGRLLQRQTQESTSIQARLAQRSDLPADYFLEEMSVNPADYYAKEIVAMHGRDSYAKKFARDFFNKDGSPKSADEIRLSERHSVLVYYKPLIQRIGQEIFGKDFVEWFEREAPASN
jgi:hypothetical protein